MRVTYFQRAPDRGRFSIEQVFDTVRSALPQEVEPRVFLAPCPTAKPWAVLRNILSASAVQGDINHITGDIHYLALGLDPMKTVLTIHDAVGLSGRLRGFKRKLLWYLWYEMPIRRSRVVTVVSHATADELCTYVPHASKKIRVIHDPVSDAFAYVPKRFNSLSPIILQVGTSKHNKNLGTVAEALRGIQCQLEIVGPLDEEQKTLLSTYGINYVNSWDLTGPDLVAKYQRADMVVFASTYEGFGLPIVEAQATGRPVITSNVSSMPEVAGDAACLVDPYDVNSIRKGVLSVIENPEFRNLLIEAGLANVGRFRPSVIAKQYYNLYREIKKDPDNGVSNLKFPGDP